MSKGGGCGVHLKACLITQTSKNCENSVETALHDSNSTFMLPNWNKITLGEALAHYGN